MDIYDSHSVIQILNDDKQMIDINRSDLPANIPNDVLYWFVKHFNAWFDHYDFNNILHELYPNHDSESADKKDNNITNSVISIEWLITTLNKEGEELSEFIVNSVPCNRKEMKNIKLTQEGLHKLLLNTKNKKLQTYYVKLEKCMQRILSNMLKKACEEFKQNQRILQQTIEEQKQIVEAIEEQKQQQEQTINTQWQ